ncbi:PD40 domain-containing protein [Candidatus Dojkabacteria bacterium]|nr:PD40 domain-containing protein [Candidatus Dojkabacteria bacterium]
MTNSNKKRLAWVAFATLVLFFILLIPNLPKSNKDPKQDVLSGGTYPREIVLASQTSPKLVQFSYSTYFPSISADGRYVAIQLDDTIIRVDRLNGTYEYVCIGVGGYPEPCSNPEISGNGRYIVFQSDSSSLPGSMGSWEDVFVRDMVTGTISLVSNTISDRTGGEYYGFAGSPSISYDGSRIAFSSSYPDHVEGDENYHVDVFVKEMGTGVISRVSVHADGSENEHDADVPFISANGRYVAFEGYGLTDEVSNYYSNVFVRDLDEGTTVLVSREMSGAECSVGSHGASLSSDGRYVVFTSQCALFVPSDSNGQTDVFMKDLVTGTFTRLSTDSSGGEISTETYSAVISANAQYVVFMSPSSEYVPGDANGTYDIFRKDISTGAVLRMSISTEGVDSDDMSSNPAISADGQYIVFDSMATNLILNNLYPGKTDVYIRDVQSSTTSVIGYSTTEPDGDVMGNSLSSDGRYLAFWSDATNFVNDDINYCSDIFVKDMINETYTLVSTSSSGEQGDNDSSSPPKISGNGRYVVFSSEATNFVDIDTNNFADVFIKDLETSTIEMVSVSSSGTQSDSSSYGLDISDDGRYVIFRSDATTLVDNDTNGLTDLFLRDRVSGTTTRVNVSPLGEQSDAEVMYSSISGDGNFIVFSSAATNIVDDDFNGNSDVFLHNRVTGETQRISFDENGLEFEFGAYTVQISYDGRYVAFGAYHVEWNSHVYLRDTLTDLTTIVSVNSEGEGSNGTSNDFTDFDRAISNDGRYIIFSSDADNLVPGFINTWGERNLYIRDVVSSETYLVSRASVGNTINGWTDSASISANGNYIAFVSNATNLTNDFPESDPYTYSFDPPVRLYFVDMGFVPLQFCGNNVIEGTEVCDGTNLAGRTCSYYDTDTDFYFGTLACAADCSGFDTTACLIIDPVTNCGNGIIDRGETCDGTNFGGLTCGSFGLPSGHLRCSSACQINTFFCTDPVALDPFRRGYIGMCGNGQIDSGEVCDGTNLSGMTCQLLSLGEGTLRCASNCISYDTSACSGYGGAEVPVTEPSIWEEYENENPFLFDENNAKAAFDEEGEKLSSDSYKTTREIISKELGSVLAAEGTSGIMAGLSILTSATTAAYMTGFTFTDTPALMQHISSSILNLFVVGKKRKRLGVVYNSLKKSPISLAIVRLFLGEKLVETAVTDNNGVFMFEIPQGNYRLQVSKAGFVFPSKIILGSTDGPLLDVYRGTELKTSSDKTILNVNIPLDPVMPSKFGAKLRTITSIVSSFITKISLPLLIFATTISMAAYFMVSNRLNLIMMLINLAVLSISLFLTTGVGNRWGFVKDVNGSPVDGVRLVLYEAEFGKAVSERFTDSQGRYSFLVPAQRYILKVEDTRYEPVEFSRTGIEIKPTEKGSFIINKSLKVRKI